MDGENPVSPEQLGIPSGDYEQPTTENQPEAEKVERDSKSETFLAEDIAQFRTDMEQKIFFDRLPRNQWKEAYEETLAANPQIQPYKDIFDDILNSTERAHDELEVFWNQHQGQEDHQVGEPARPEVSKILFESIFGFYPERKTQATKGTASLQFVIDDSDFMRIPTRGGREEISKGNAFVLHTTVNRGFPVMVLSLSIPEEDWNDKGVHESEHVKSQLIETGRLYFHHRLFPERLTIPSAINNRLERRNKAASPMENAAKDEILAYLTETEWVDPANPPSEVTRYSKERGEEVQQMLTSGDDYLPTYKEMFNPTDEEEKSYLESVKKATDSSVQLFNMYFSTSNNSRESTRMTINVLEQFSLRSWPAVVRLLKARHEDKNTQV